jgi:thioredoxin-like negative regulator of GroEL
MATRNMPKAVKRDSSSLPLCVYVYTPLQSESVDLIDDFEVTHHHEDQDGKIFARGEQPIFASEVPESQHPN